MYLITRDLEFLKIFFDSEQITFVMDSIVEGKKQAFVYVNKNNS